MSEIWPKFNKQNPCPACQHWDWTCRAGQKKFVCMRVESSHPAKDGGWFHEYGDTPKPIRTFPKRIAPKVNLDFNRMWLDSEVSGNDIFYLAEQLGVLANALEHLGCSMIRNDYCFPFRDGENKIIGIHLRGDDGSKKAVTGSRNGLFIPQIEPQKVCYLPEGISNTAALLTMGFFAIGRPSCNSGGEMLKIALKRLGVHRVVIVADNDGEKDLPNGKTFRPGQDGAKKLKKELGLMSVIFTPPNPIKDVRQLLQKLGVESARKVIEGSVNQKKWSKE